MDPGQKWISIPPLEQKFRFRLPTNCHVSKSITACLTHATKISDTAQQRLLDGEVSIEFGLRMDNGPIDDSLSAHSYHKHHSPKAARLANRHHDCKISVSLLF